MSDRGYVVLLHGLGRSKLSLHLAQRRLRRHGFEVVNLNYPSRSKRIEELADFVGAEIEKRCTRDDRPVHFVTHSLGGIIVRYFLVTHGLPNLGRVVMLSPPNRGSEIAELLKNNPLFRIFTGPAGLQLGVGEDSLPARLGPPDYELGIIAGNRSLNPMFSLLVGGENDGTVSVESSRLRGMKDFLVVPRTHTFIMNSPSVLDQVIVFLEEGRFRRERQQENDP